MKYIVYFGVFVAVSGLIGLVGIFGWQVFHYLYFGNWVPVSIISGMQILDIAWAHNPSTWIGLHKVLNFVHLGVGLAICCWVFGALIASVED